MLDSTAVFEGSSKWTPVTWTTQTEAKAGCWRVLPVMHKFTESTVLTELDGAEQGVKEATCEMESYMPS